MGMRSCKELREAKDARWYNKALTADDLATYLASLSVAGYAGFGAASARKASP